MLENIRLSFRGIWSHRLRSFLTMLGIIIGIAAIIAIVSTIEGTNEQIKENLVGSGTNAVSVTLCQDGWSYEFDYAGKPDIQPFSDELREQIRALDTVERASFIHQRDYIDGMKRLGTDLSSCSLYGVDDGYFATAGYTLVRGRGFSARDMAAQAQTVCILDETTYSTAFGGEDPLGGTIEIRGVPFTVIGIAASSTQFEPTINTLDDWYTYSSDRTGKVFIPASAWPLVFRFDEPETVVVRAVNTDAMTDAGKAVANLINSALGLDASSSTSLQYQSQDLLSQASDLQQLASSTNIMLVAIASISLLVGGIGVMNIMLVSVTERTREIGIRKAIGAGNGSIMAQFLVEALMLSLMGCGAGIGASWGILKIIDKVAGYSYTMDRTVCLLAVGFSLLIGLVFGIYPAGRAAKKRPIEALHYSG